MSKNRELEAKRAKKRAAKAQQKARKAASKVYPAQHAHGYVAPAGHEVTELEVLNGPQITADAYLDHLEASGNAGAKPWAYEVRRQKHAGGRPKPSASLTSVGERPPLQARASLLDQIAVLVDEHVFGRGDMCLQFAALAERAMTAMGIRAEARVGRAEYRRNSGAWMQWQHAWVVLDDGTIIDGNADSIRENRVIGQGIMANSYWGPRASLPDDRRIPDGTLLADRDRNDPDVVNRWWPMLQTWMQQQHLLAPPPPPPAPAPQA